MQAKREIKPVSVEDMVDLDDMKTREDKFRRDHPPLDDEAIKQAKRDSRNAQMKWTKDIQRVEENLLDFFKKDFPLVIDNEVRAWVKDVHYFKLLQMIPDEVLTDMQSQEETDMITILMKLKEGYGDYNFKIMAELIRIPEKDWEWWKENANQSFIDAFNDFLESRINKVSDDINFF